MYSFFLANIHEKPLKQSTLLITCVVSRVFLMILIIFEENTLL